MPTALITGVSSGIGRATAALFLERGWNVVGTVRGATSASPGPHPNLLLLPLDLAQPEGIAPLLRATAQRFGPIDLLISNAGYGHYGALEAVPQPLWQRQMQVNLLGPVALIRAVLPGMRERGSGTILCVSSIAAHFGLPFGGAYHASKAALDAMCDALRFEVAPFGIHVRLVEPGAIRTDFFARSMQFAQHAEYMRAEKRMRWVMRRIQPYLPGPEVVARRIWQAGTAKGGRLRYPVRAHGRLLQAWLPDVLWRRLIRLVG